MNPPKAEFAGETVAAVATPPGQGAIAVLRMSGVGAFEVGSRVFRGSPAFGEIPPRLATFGRIIDAEGQAIDEVLLTKFPGPASYTGEDVVEISCHGGMLVTRAILDRLLEAGARSAQPGEFTQRAFLNGKMDLTRAEAVMDVISAQTDLALRAANEQLRGRLGELAEQLRRELIGVIAHVEAFIDFPDEDIDPQTGDRLLRQLGTVRATVRQLTDTAERGRILREGVRTVIAGAPNVGKSSLLNVLLGFDRAIVSETAGTTRDTIEETIDLHGIPLRLVDTAGVRDAEDEIEREGVLRAENQISNADLVLEVFDASRGTGKNAASLNLPSETRRVAVLNKADLGVHEDWAESAGVAISCTQRTGIDELTERILETLRGSGGDWGGHTVAINARHQACLARAGYFLDVAAEKLASGESPEFTALELRSALDAIAEMVGKTDVEEILGEIFSTFCIGK